MKRSLLTTLAALAVAGVVVSPAVAATKAQLRHRLANMTDARNAVAQKLATTEATDAATISQLRAMIATTQATLDQRTSERDVARSQVDALQKQIANEPTPLEVAIEQVRREVAYQEHGGLLPYSHGRLVAQAALDYVVGHVSASAYGWDAVFGGTFPAATPDSVLGAQAGICGHASLTFAAIVKRFGVAARSVQFYYIDPAPWSTPDSHIAVEVYYDGGWHFFDPTFDNYWTPSGAAGGDVLSIADVRAGIGSEVKNEAEFTNLAENVIYGDSTAFETDAATRVEIDQQQFVG